MATGGGMVATLVTLQKYVFGPISDGQQCCPPELVPNNVGWLKKIHDSLGDRREDVMAKGDGGTALSGSLSGFRLCQNAQWGS